MEIAVIFSPSNIHVGSTCGALYICSHDPDTFVPLSSTPVGGKPGLTKEKTTSGADIVYPVGSFMAGLNELDPDGILIFTLTQELYDNMDEIAGRWPVAWRYNANPLELFIRRDMRDTIPHILNMPNKVDAVVTATEGVEKDLKSLGWRNTVTIPPCINVEDFDQSEPEEDVVVSMTRMTSVKNFITSVFAMRSVIRHRPSVKYEIYGKGELSSYVNRIVEMTGSDRITYKGYEEADEILSRAKVLLQLSLSENMSLSPLEAMASGTPCVVSDINGHPNSQIRVPHDSVHKAVAAVEQLLDDDEYYNEKRREGLKEVKKYDVEAISPEYEAMFENLMELKRRFKK